MLSAELSLVEDWMGEPHVARWYLRGSTLEDEIEDLRRSIDGDQATTVLLVLDGDEPIGWCQWYLCREYPEHAAGVGADGDDAGIDYAIGAPTHTGQGVGSALVAVLVAHIRSQHPGVAVIADPAAANLASRRVLEKNGFELLDERVVPSERSQEPVAIYRLPGEG